MIILGSNHSYGTDLLRRESEGVVCALTSYPPETRFPIHGHENPGFHFIIRGQHRDLRASGEVDQPPGTLAYFDIGSPHGRLIGPEGMIGMSAAYSPSVLESEGLNSAMFTPITGSRDGMWTVLGYRLLAAILYSSEEATFVDASLEALLPLARPPDAKRPQWLFVARDFLESEFRNRIGLRKAARVAGVDAVHLARVFRHHFGCSVGKYIQKLRLAEAFRTLEREGTSLGEAAVLAGFSDQAHFTRLCRREIGTSPRNIARYETRLKSHRILAEPSAVRNTMLSPPEAVSLYRSTK